MRRLLPLLLITIVFSVTPVFAQKRSITEKDLFSFVWIGDPQISPDGSRVAFVKVTVNEKKDGYNTSIWSVSSASGEILQLTNGTRDSSPRWSPDGKYLVFVRVSEKDGRPDQPQLFMLAMSGGDSFQFTSLPKGAGQPRWSPDGKTVVFISTTNPDDLKKQKDAGTQRDQSQPQPFLNATGAEANNPEDKHESDVRVITRAVYRSNGGGYLDFKRPPHIWIVPAPRNAADQSDFTSMRRKESRAWLRLMLPAARKRISPAATRRY